MPIRHYIYLCVRILFFLKQVKICILMLVIDFTKL